MLYITNKTEHFIFKSGCMCRTGGKTFKRRPVHSSAVAIAA